MSDTQRDALLEYSPRELFPRNSRSPEFIPDLRNRPNRNAAIPRIRQPRVLNLAARYRKAVSSAYRKRLHATTRIPNGAASMANPDCAAPAAKTIPADCAALPEPNRTK